MAANSNPFLFFPQYAKEVITYVDKRASLELELARGLSKLAQPMRQALSEEKYMPLRSVFCAAVDNDLEMCSNALRTCSELQGNKFVEPLQQRLSEQNKARDALKKRWRKELRRVSEAVSTTRSLFYKGWLIRDGYLEPVKILENLNDAVVVP